jgi:diadenosine tetraphosphate (Ap4A) HIT family hydrolase
MSFEIHPQLLADCHLLGRLPGCHLLLHRNAALPWFILVPETERTDVLDLPAAQRNFILAECAQVAEFIKRRWQLPKVNFGAIGNVVPQMHLHVIGRSPGDPCWPKPVWGNLAVNEAYPEQELGSIVQALRQSIEEYTSA